ncbi:MlaD family protein [Haliangium sp.]|uniref:MlaD family protein n=1 Tax=Haliangium sp. TaxID=2663208 RepID=UPI003D0CE0A6
MKHISNGVKVGILVLVMAAAGYGVWQSIGGGREGAGAAIMVAKFKDASGMPVGSRVVVAGLPVGDIAELGIEGRYAKVSFRLREDIPVWSNAIVFKKSSSLLGDYYLEVDPGTERSLDAQGNLVTNQRLPAGAEIPTVIEATSPDELLRRVNESMPNVDAVLLSMRDLSEDLRRVVNGPLASVSERIDGLVQTEAEHVSSILARLDRSMANIEAISGDIRGFTGGSNSQVERILDRLEEAATEARDLVVTARTEVEQTGATVREKLDQVDQILESTSSIARKIDGDEGTLGRLVNDSTIADNVEEITDDAKSFLGSLVGLQTYVGLRSEYAVGSGLSQHYISVELAPRPDKYYLVELSKGPRGGYPQVSLEYDPVVDDTTYYRKVTIEDNIRFTLQLAKRWGWATLRYGLKDSSGGVGFDAETVFFGRTFKLQTDAFDFDFDSLPRLKASASYEVFQHLYLLGGIDDALNNPQYLPLTPGEGGALDVPILFDRYRYGRDYFVGAMLRFNDRDLAALLTVGGSAASAVATQ